MKYDSRGTKPSSYSDPVPDGDYVLQIIKTEESQSRSGYPMVKVTANVDFPSEYSGVPIFHYVTFFEKGMPGAGISLHFLKCIGQPYEESESLDIQPKDWEMKKFKAKVIQEPYSTPDGKKGVSNKIKSVGMLETSEIPF